MRLLGCFCVFLSGFYCVPLVFSSVLEENATSEVLQPSQQPGRLFSEASSPKKPVRSMSQSEAPSKQSSGVEGGGEH